MIPDKFKFSRALLLKIFSVLFVSSALCCLLLPGCAAQKESRQNGGTAPRVISAAGTRYWGMAADNESIFLFDTKDSSRNRVIQCYADTAGFASALSPARNKVLLGFYDTKKKETLCFLYLLNERSLRPLRAIKGMQHCNFVWMNDSLFFVNTYEKKAKGKTFEYAQGTTELFNAYTLRSLQTFKPKGCSALLAQLKQKYLVYGDQKDITIIDAQTKKVHKEIKDLNLSGKHIFAFSPDGNQLITVQPVKTKSASGAQLMASRYDGTEDKIILGPEYDPASVQWVPGSNIIVCNIRSQEHAGVRHVAMIDMSTYRTSFRSGGTEENIPSFFNLAASPGGNFLLLLKTQAAGDKEKRNYVLRDLRNDRDFTLKDSLGAFQADEIGDFASWPQESILVFENSRYGSVTYNLFTRSFTALPYTRLLFVQESE